MTILGKDLQFNIMIVYIDLNIFDRLEKIEKIDPLERQNYQDLLSMLINNHIQTAYSNAHLNDLFRGYKKNPSFIDGHLNNIKTLTKNLCICQYWGSAKVTWSYRDIISFFNDKVEEEDFLPDNYDDFINGIFSDIPPLSPVYEIYKRIPLPPNFKKGYKEPMFGIMYPLSKIYNTQYALQADIYNFHLRLRSDFGLYKSFRSYLLNSLNKLKNNKEILKSMTAANPDLPKHLEMTDLFDAYTPKNKTSDNNLYSKVIDTFFKFDLAGYKADGHFNNMFDDGLHTFYASHFDFFVTNDDRCKYKAEKTYQKLKIETCVIKINEIYKIKDALNLV